MHSEHTKPLHTNQGPMQVKKCACGGVHLCLGSISINLAYETAVNLQEQLHDATGSPRREFRHG